MHRYQEDEMANRCAGAEPDNLHSRNDTTDANGNLCLSDNSPGTQVASFRYINRPFSLALFLTLVNLFIEMQVILTVFTPLVYKKLKLFCLYLRLNLRFCFFKALGITILQFHHMIPV